MRVFQKRRLLANRNLCTDEKKSLTTGFGPQTASSCLRGGQIASRLPVPHLKAPGDWRTLGHFATAHEVFELLKDKKPALMGLDIGLGAILWFILGVFCR